MVAMSIDVERARADTPGCEPLAHLDNAGAALPPRPVLEAQVEWLRAEATGGGYQVAAARSDERRATYDEVASLIGAATDEVALTENATFAWHQAFWSLPLRPGDRVLTCTVEYASSYLSYLQAIGRRGIEVEVVPDDEHGQVSTAALEGMLADTRRPVGLVAVTHVPTNGGVVNPVEEIGRLTRAAGVPFLLDACQSVGQMPVDVDAIGCDLLSATGRKFLRGPRGTGFLYVRSSLLDRLDPAFCDLLGAEWVTPDRYELRPDARRFESWESNLAAQAGLRAAVAYARSWGLDHIGARVAALAAGLRERLASLPGVKVRDLGLRRSGIVTFTCDGADAHDVVRDLGAQAVNVSVSVPSSTLLDARRRRLPPLVRASVHYYNDESDLDRLVAGIARR
jgi:selenocysteine lyase/cysteine desulfurase